MNINELPTIKLSSRAKNLTNKRQGKLTFLKPAEKQNNRIFWWVQCECGNIEKLRTDTKKLQCSKCTKLLTTQKLKKSLSNDLTGKVFGRLIVLFPTKKQQGMGMMWHCKCECGNEIDVKSGSLVSGNTKSCGCLKQQHANFTKLKKDLIGKHFGKLTVIEETTQRQYGKIVWKCQCECGNIIYLNTTRLTQHNDISCGCQKNSLGASNIEKILQNHNINYIKEYVVHELNNKRFDFALIDDNNKPIRFIEFDGEQHYRYSGGWNTKENLIITQKRDKIKNKWAKDNDIPLVRIPYWERDNITLDIIMGDKYRVVE